MEDSILNSLLRYSRQTTPSRETYPIPYNGWYHHLRKSDPEINLSTYYLLDNPLLSSNKPLQKLSSCISTIGFSSKKVQNFVKSSQKQHKNHSMGYSKKLTEAEIEIKKIVEREKEERSKFALQQKVYEGIEKKLNEKKGKGEDRDRGESFNRDQEDVVENMKKEIESLKKELMLNNQKMKTLQEKND